MIGEAWCRMANALRLQQVHKKLLYKAFFKTGRRLPRRCAVSFWQFNPLLLQT